MSNKKKIRTRGKLSLSRHFQNLKKGDSVTVIAEQSQKRPFPKRLQGRTGNVIEKRGRSYMVDIKDQARKKKFLIAPIHLKKI